MSYETKDPAGAKELLDEETGWVYIDVRTVEEFENKHVPGARNIPIAMRAANGQMMLNEDFVEVVRKHFAPDRKLILGCAAGVRSARACELLVAHGYTTTVNMSGGFSGARDMMGNIMEAGWESLGFACETTPAPGCTYTELSA